MAKSYLFISPPAILRPAQAAQRIAPRGIPDNGEIGLTSDIESITLS